LNLSEFGSIDDSSAIEVRFWGQSPPFEGGFRGIVRISRDQKPLYQSV